MPNKIFVTEDKAEELNKYRVNPNDVIISRSGTVGEICLVPSNEEHVISTNLIRVRLNQNNVNPKYFVYMFQGDEFDNKFLIYVKVHLALFLIKQFYHL